MCEICFTSNSVGTKWNEGDDMGEKIEKSQLEFKLLEIHAMLNGKKFAEEKKLFGPPVDKELTESAMKEHNSKLTIR